METLTLKNQLSKAFDGKAVCYFNFEEKEGQRRKFQVSPSIDTFQDRWLLIEINTCNIWDVDGKQITVHSGTDSSLQNDKSIKVDMKDKEKFLSMTDKEIESFIVNAYDNNNIKHMDFVQI